MRKTKILCTVGPATQSVEMLQQLVKAGANVFRLNMSHSPHEVVRQLVPRIRAVAKESGVVIGILMDTQGPAIRTGVLPEPLTLKPGDVFEFTIGDAPAREAYSVGVNYDGLIDDISVGDKVLVDNGVIHMRAVAKGQGRIRCEVLTDGVMGSRRHINLPGVKVNLPALTEKDLEDVALGAELGVDYVALSFCREAGDVDALRKVLHEHGSHARIVAKIEDQSAVRNVNAIIDNADIVMVARGDLGVECPMEELPIIQRKIVKRCMQRGRPVIVATHMLESMISSPVPTRAEITDVANAVYEQADAIMLSGETSVGKYPVQCVQVFDRVARRIERSGGAGFASQTVLRDDRQRTVNSAVVLANSLPGAKMILFTRRGTMADYVSTMRPVYAPLYAFAPTYEICRRIVLNWGVTPFCLPFDPNPLRTIGAAQALLLAEGLVKSGDHLVIVSDMLAGEDRFDSVQLRVVP